MDHSEEARVPWYISYSCPHLHREAELCAVIGVEAGRASDHSTELLDEVVIRPECHEDDDAPVRDDRYIQKNGGGDSSWPQMFMEETGPEVHIE